MFGCVTPLGRLISVYKNNVEHLFSAFWVNMAKWTWRSRSMPPIYNISQKSQDAPLVPIWWSDDHSLCLGWLPHVFVFFVTLCCPWASCHVRLGFSYHTSYHADISPGLYTLSISPKTALKIYVYLQYVPHGHGDFFFVGVWPNTCKFSNLSWLGVLWPLLLTWFNFNPSMDK